MKRREVAMKRREVAMKREGVLVGALLAVALVLGSCAGTPASDAPDGEPDEVRFGFTVPGPDVGTAGLWAAEALGYFEDENLSLEITYYDGSVSSARALATGEVDYVYGTLEPIPQFIEDGHPQQVIYQLASKPIFSLAIPVGSELDEPQDLAEKLVGVVGAGSAATGVLKHMVEEVGVDYEDVTIVPIGFGPEAFAAVEQGEVDALMFWDTAYPNFEAAGLEFTYHTSEELDRGYASMGISYDPTRRDELSDISPRFLRAFTKGQVLALIDPLTAIEAMGELVPEVLEDVELSLKKVEAANSRNLPPPDDMFGRSSPEEWERLLDVLIGTDIITERPSYDVLFDDRYLEAANDFDRQAIREDVESYSEGDGRGSEG